MLFIGRDVVPFAFVVSTASHGVADAQTSLRLTAILTL